MNINKLLKNLKINYLQPINLNQVLIKANNKECALHNKDFFLKLKRKK